MTADTLLKSALPSNMATQYPCVLSIFTSSALLGITISGGNQGLSPTPSGYVGLITQMYTIVLASRKSYTVITEKNQ